MWERAYQARGALRHPEEFSEVRELIRVRALWDPELHYRHPLVEHFDESGHRVAQQLNGAFGLPGTSNVWPLAPSQPLVRIQKLACCL